MNENSFGIFLRYTVLSVLGMLGVSCYILADTFFIARGLGADGLTALNLAIPVYNVIHGTGLMLGMGGATKFSIFRSRGERAEMDAVYTNTLQLTIPIALLFSLSGVLFSEGMARLLGADAAVRDMTVTYLWWLLLFSPAFMLNDVFLCFVRNDGAPQLASMAMMVGSVSNIILDYIFIFPMRLGMFGAIIATCLSPLISIAVLSVHWMGNRRHYRLTAPALRREMTAQQLSLGFPSFVGQLSGGIVMVVFNLLILRLEGNIGVAAYGVTANLALVVCAIYNGMAQGVQPLLSTCCGTKDRVGERRLLRYSMASMAVVSGVIFALIVTFAQPIAALFNAAGDMQMQALAVRGLRLYFTCCLALGFNTVLAAYFTSVERAKPAHLLSLLRGLVLIIPAAVSMAALWGMDGVWLSCTVTEMAAALLGIVVFLRTSEE